MKPNIKDFDLSELKELLLSSGEQRYRAEQVLRAIYIYRISSFDEIKIIPKHLRDYLTEKFKITVFRNISYQHSSDGTIKFLFHLSDGEAIESVLIPSEFVNNKKSGSRKTLCVSTQVGCTFNCAFCATGKLKFKRNLNTSEIIEQYLQAEKFIGEKITNIVFMGMGEPLLNYDNVKKAVIILLYPMFKLINSKKITISTSGFIPGIIKLADEHLPVKLALSLHATTQGLRDKLLPNCKSWKLKELFDSMEYYYRKTSTPVTYEYILFDGINDTQDDIKRLSRISKRIPSKINLIPFHTIDFTNPTGFSETLKPASGNKIHWFLRELKNKGINAFLRTSSGLDIDAACGQLALKSGLS